MRRRFAACACQARDRKRKFAMTRYAKGTQVAPEKSEMDVAARVLEQAVEVVR